MSVLVARPLFEGVVVGSALFMCSENNLENPSNVSHILSTGQAKYWPFKFFYLPKYIIQLILILIQAIDIIRIIL